MSEWKPAKPSSLITSMSVRRCRNDFTNSTLTLVLNGSKYKYRDVPNSLIISMMASKSLGQFYNRRIKGKFKVIIKGEPVPWVASQSDLLSIDWTLVKKS